MSLEARHAVAKTRLLTNLCRSLGGFFSFYVNSERNEFLFKRQLFVLRWGGWRLFVFLFNKVI